MNWSGGRARNLCSQCLQAHIATAVGERNIQADQTVWTNRQKVRGHLAHGHFPRAQVNGDDTTSLITVLVNDLFIRSFQETLRKSTLSLTSLSATEHAISRDNAEEHGRPEHDRKRLGVVDNTTGRVAVTAAQDDRGCRGRRRIRGDGDSWRERLEYGRIAGQGTIDAQRKVKNASRLKALSVEDEPQLLFGLTRR